ncbi:MAG: DsbE family thiol:disulfide interchange protein [Gammaproteobacteria bacterium]|nr:DsbE family thiol:disulfide interchange protein [Gammaproteobacteria bacterium]
MMRYAPLGIFAVVVVVFLVGLTRDPREVPSPLIGKPVPEFSLETLSHPQTRIARADLLGKITLINFWATWCVGCREEHPLLIEVAREPGVTLIGMNYKDERPAALDWLRRHGDPYRQSGFDQSGRLGLDLGVYGLPETFLVDAEGTVIYKQTGPLTPRIWERELRPLIERLNRQSGNSG